MTCLKGDSGHSVFNLKIKNYYYYYYYYLAEWLVTGEVTRYGFKSRNELMFI
jgi:hypothetical protein